MTVNEGLVPEEAIDETMKAWGVSGNKHQRELLVFLLETAAPYFYAACGRADYGQHPLGESDDWSPLPNDELEALEEQELAESDTLANAPVPEEAIEAAAQVLEQNLGIRDTLTAENMLEAAAPYLYGACVGGYPVKD